MTTYQSIVIDIFKGVGIEVSSEQISKAKNILIAGIRDKAIERFMFVEDGSLKDKDLKEIKRRAPEIKIVVYRQGSPMPIMQDA